MRKPWKNAAYATKLVSDNDEGWIALELHQTDKGQGVLAARVVFWDAEGQFSLEVLVDERPLTIVEEPIAEAKLRGQNLESTRVHSDVDLLATTRQLIGRSNQLLAEVRRPRARAAAAPESAVAESTVVKATSAEGKNRTHVTRRSGCQGEPTMGRTTVEVIYPTGSCPRRL